MGTNDYIFVLHSLITNIINSNKQLFCAFIDFSKAFDYVVRDNMWYKHFHLGIRGKMLDLIQSIYSHVSSRVRVSSERGEIFESFLGVRQWDCLSPFLFSMYINNLENTLVENNSKCIDIGHLKLFLLMYADDIVIFAKNPKELQ